MAQNRVELIATLRDNLSGPLRRTGQGLQRFGRTARNAAIAITAVATATLLAAKKLADYGASIYDMSDATGIGIQALQGLSYGIEQAGGSTRNLSMALRTQARFVGYLEQGMKTYTQYLPDLGLAYEDLEAKSPEETFHILAEALAGVQDEVRRTEIGMVMFGGRGMSSILAALEQFDGSLRNAQGQFEEFGHALSDEQVGKLKTYADAMTDVSFALKGFAADALVPILEPLMGVMDVMMDMAEKTLPQLAPILEAVTILFGHMAEGLLEADFTGNIVDTVLNLFNALLPVIETVLDAIEPLTAEFGNLVTVLADVLVPVLEMVTPAITPIIEIMADFIAVVMYAATGPLTLLSEALEGVVNWMYPAKAALEELAEAEATATTEAENLADSWAEAIGDGADFSTAIADITAKVYANALAFGAQSTATIAAKAAYEDLIAAVYGSALEEMQQNQINLTLQYLNGEITLAEARERGAILTSVYGDEVGELNEALADEIEHQERLEDLITAMPEPVLEDFIDPTWGADVEDFERHLQEYNDTLDAYNFLLELSHERQMDLAEGLEYADGILDDALIGQRTLGENLKLAVTEGWITGADAVQQYSDAIDTNLKAGWTWGQSTEDLANSEEQYQQTKDALVESFASELLAINAATEGAEEYGVSVGGVITTVATLIEVQAALREEIQSRQEARLEGVDAINAEYDAEIERLNELAEAYTGLEELQLAIDETEADRQQALHDLEMANIEEARQAKITSYQEQEALEDRIAQKQQRLHDKNMSVVGDMASIFDQFGVGVSTALTEGEEGVDRWADNLIKQLVRVVSQKVFLMVLNIFSGGVLGAGGSLFGNLFSAAGKGKQGGGIIRHAQGGEYVPDTGAYGDRHLYLLERGERVIPREQVLAEQTGSGSGGIVNIQMNYRPLFGSASQAEMTQAGRQIIQVLRQQGVTIG